ncbi:uncharacterized protein LOC125234719 [Leguminivora glycinivorella]|uniref:uncharacterized protein LOC125234719 n=1 Tax=Leguminivora glycinivorella TaxID=1035111 RepID=UPI00200EA8A8|nr:uncharacterized protein LOC125234719 [Leguminivora glycinivorella]
MATITMSELSTGIEDATTNAPCKKVLEGILNDYMDLAYGKETPYTTGKTIVPSGSTIEDVNKAIADGTTKKPYKDVFVRISETVKSGHSASQKNDGSWDAKLTPVLVLVRANNA